MVPRDFGWHPHRGAVICVYLEIPYRVDQAEGRDLEFKINGLTTDFEEADTGRQAWRFLRLSLA